MRDPVTLPPHRIALRALLGGVMGGSLAGLTLVGVVVVLADGLGGLRPGEVLLLTLGAVAGCAMWCGLLTLGREVAMHLPSPARYGAPVLLAATLLLAIGAAGTWAGALSEGRGMEYALQQFMRLLSEFRRTPKETTVVTVALGLPFLGLTTLGLLERGRVLPRQLKLHLAVAGCAGFASLALVGLTLQPGLGEGDLPSLLGVAVGVPMAGAFGLWLAEALEPRLVAWWRARRE